MVRRWMPAVFRWSSAFILVYLGLFYWLDALIRLWRDTSPTPVSLAAVVVTGLAACRAFWFSESWSWALSAGAVGGMLADFKPDVAFLCLAALALVLGLTWRRPTNKTLLGRSVPWPRPVALTTSERFLHLHVLGPTGSGKSSSVLMPLIAQDLVQGHGLFVLDPKGDLASAAYGRALAQERLVIRFNPADTDCPHLNPLSGPADSAAEGLVWALNQISPGGHPYYAVSARVQLLHAVRVIKACLNDDADIGTVLTFFRDGVRQRQLVREARDPAAQAYFEEQWARKSSAAREDHQGLVNRLELLWANPQVRRVLSTPPDFTWDTVLRESWVVLATLSLSELGESARALGSLLWHGLAQAAYRRNPAQPHPPFFAYLDEFYQWVNDDIGDFLALARGHQVGLTLAHQDLGQLSQPLQEAVLANARHRVILPGTAADDIARFSRSWEPYAVTPRLRYLRQGWAVAETTQSGRLRPPRIIRLPYLALGAASGDDDEP